jgi:hypothetical protein
MGVVEREAKAATGQSGTYLRISMVHQEVVRPVSHGVIALIEVETLSVDLFNVVIKRMHIHSGWRLEGGMSGKRSFILLASHQRSACRGETMARV